MLLRNLVKLLKIPTILLIGVLVLTIAPAAAQVIVPPAPPYPPPVMPPFLPPAPPRNFVTVAEHTVDAVIDGPHSAIYDEAENRLHTAKAVMALTMGGR